MRRMGGGVRLAVVGLAMGLGIAVGGCELKDGGDNLVAGKQAFVQRCGSCHVLARANTTGVVGPNLDQAFQQARRDGLGESTFAGMVHAQILNPARSPQVDPKANRPLVAMPANLVTGETAEDVAAYVAEVAGVPGEDSGQLADIGRRRENAVAQAKSGNLDVPADPDGQLAYTFASARAEAGRLVIRSPNESSVDHNIALEGGGLNERGPVVRDGGVSELQVTVEPGRYTFYCSVPGHREGGMAGPLTVE